MFEGALLRVGFQKCASRSSGEHIFVKTEQLSPNSSRITKLDNAKIFKISNKGSKKKKL